MLEILIIAGVIVVLAIFVITTYNSLVSLRVRVESGWSDITIQLKRRADLIPALVSTVKGYATHEQEVFENVTKARAGMDTAKGVSEVAKSENMLQEALKSLFAVAEAYPELQANSNFLDLQAQLTDTENKVMASRRFYNGTVREFNTKQQLFPVNIVAALFRFKNAEFFEVEDTSINNPPTIEF